LNAIVVKQIGRFEYVRVPDPAPGSGEVLVQVAVAGLCRTDLKLIEVGHRDLVLPRIPAEEVVGEVIGIGAGVSVNWMGKRVYLYPGTSCGKCPPCLVGAGNLCREMRIMGFHRDGGFAERVVAPVDSLIELPEGLSYEAAVFAEPLSCCLNALELARLKPGERIGIWGGGPAGTLLERAARSMGAASLVMEPDAGRRQGDRLAGMPAGLVLDVAIVAVGDATAYQHAFSALGPRGRLVVFSGLLREAAIQSLDLNRLHYLEQTVVGAYGCSRRHGEQALEWIAARRIDVEDLITHRLPLSELGRALDLVRHRVAMKVLMYPMGKGSCNE
jgi:L-iditol 2-dehydrogenase